MDDVEIEAIESNIEGTPTKILGSKTLHGEKAAEFGKLWRAQHYLLGQVANCHQPGYRIKFYDQSSLVIETTLCYNCEDIFFQKPGFGPYGASFDSNTGPGKLMRSYLGNLFPGHDLEAPHS